MKYQKIIVGAAVGSALAGLGFLLFHPSGKQFRRKAVDLGLDAADKFIDYIRASKTEYEAGSESTQSQRQASEVIG